MLRSFLSRFNDGRLSWDEAFSRIEPIPTPDYPGGRWPKIRYHKMKAFFELAQAAKGGCIVELGTWRGLGACTLALGAPKGTKVYTIDNYAEKIDALRYIYDRYDQHKFEENVAGAGLSECIHLKVGDAEVLARNWDEPIALLVWDLGIDRLWRDFTAWSRHIIPSGVFAYKDLETRQFSHGLSEDGLVFWRKHRDFPDGCVYSLERNNMRGFWER